MKKLKKIFVSIVTFIITIPSKVFGASRDISVSLYAVEKPQIEPTPYSKFNWLGFFQLFAIPVILLIGSFIYFKKSNKSKKIKLIVVVIILLLVLLYILIFFNDTFFNNYNY